MLLSKGASSEEMGNQDHHLHLCETDTENTSLLVNNSNISLLFPPDTFMVITFAGALRQALLHLFEAELFSCADGTHCCCGTLNTVEPHRLVLLSAGIRTPRSNTKQGTQTRERTARAHSKPRTHIKTGHEGSVRALSQNHE